ncbi:MAG TPA: hypothetical protein VEY70_13215 [Metabacillus sp.]|nr:hypothetical protein [Metabacillus sp.]
MLTSEHERKIYRTKLLKQIEEKKNNVVKKQQASALEKMLKATGIPHISAFRFQICRWLLILFSLFYYVGVPLVSAEEFDRSTLAFPLIIYVLSEPKFKFSPVYKFIEYLISRKRKKKIVELFTLFDILKAELNTLQDWQEVNIYNILKETVPMFEHINGTISRFLSKWKTSPDEAKMVFYDEIGVETARVLGEVLFKLDKASKKEALNIIEAESGVFSYTYYEKAIQSSIKQKNLFFVLFSVNILLIMAWLIIVIYTMFVNTINQSYPL